MRLRPAFLLAILVYVTLDFSLAMMPGAFEFEPSDSVETVQVNRARLAGKIVALPAIPANGLALPSAPIEVNHGRSWTGPPEGHDPKSMAWSPRAARAPAPASSQDPH